MICSSTKIWDWSSYCRQISSTWKNKTRRIYFIILLFGGCNFMDYSGSRWICRWLGCYFSKTRIYDRWNACDACRNLSFCFTKRRVWTFCYFKLFQIRREQNWFQLVNSAIHFQNCYFTCTTYLRQPTFRKGTVGVSWNVFINKISFHTLIL